MRMKFILSTLAVLVLSPGIMPAPAAGEDDSIEPAVDQICGAIANVCAATCYANDPNGEYPALQENCLENCNADEDACNGDMAAPGRGAGAFGPGQSAGVLAEDTPDDRDLFGISLVTSARVENVCSKVSGALFNRTERSYGCLNNTCGGPGTTCLIYCADGKCFGGMPEKPAGGLTLLGILQNGDNVDRGGKAQEPSGSIGGGGGGGGAGPGGEEEGPECGIGGCGPIL